MRKIEVFNAHTVVALAKEVNAWFKKNNEAKIESVIPDYSDKHNVYITIVYVD